MQPTPELIDDIYRQRVLRARAMSPDAKLLGGLRLFDDVYRRMLDGIRNQHPDVDEHRVREILIERLNMLRRLEEHGLFRAAGESP